MCSLLPPWRSRTSHCHLRTALPPARRTDACGTTRSHLQAWLAWLRTWKAALVAQGSPDAERMAGQDAVNPMYIPRQHLLQYSITAAEKGDMSELETLMTVRLPVGGSPMVEPPGSSVHSHCHRIVSLSCSIICSCCLGPGGMRVGLAACKGLGHATSAPSACGPHLLFGQGTVQVQKLWPRQATQTGCWRAFLAQRLASHVPLN